MSRVRSALSFRKFYPFSARIGFWRRGTGMYSLTGHCSAEQAIALSTIPLTQLDGSDRAWGDGERSRSNLFGTTGLNCCIYLTRREDLLTKAPGYIRRISGGMKCG